jgi:hypothetical protein
MEQIKEKHPHRGDWLREIVSGLNDGLVTTLVFLMAVSEVATTRLLPVVLVRCWLAASQWPLEAIFPHRQPNRFLNSASQQNGMRLSMSQKRNEQNW